ncbi:MAG: type II toxin-antitoxin system YafQ family toxin [Anaerolineae bacterium]
MRDKVKIARTERFKRAYRKLTPENREGARKALRLLLQNLRHPSLRVKRIRGTRDIWEARVTCSCRMTFQIEDDICLLRNIGEHDEGLGKP